MPKYDAIKDAISKIEEEIIRVEHEMDKLEKQVERIHQKRILNGIRRGEKGNIINM